MGHGWGSGHGEDCKAKVKARARARLADMVTVTDRDVVKDSASARARARVRATAMAMAKSKATPMAKAKAKATPLAMAKATATATVRLRGLGGAERSDRGLRRDSKMQLTPLNQGREEEERRGGEEGLEMLSVQAMWCGVEKSGGGEKGEAGPRILASHVIVGENSAGLSSILRLSRCTLRSPLSPRQSTLPFPVRRSRESTSAQTQSVPKPSGGAVGSDRGWGVLELVLLHMSPGVERRVS